MIRLYAILAVMALTAGSTAGAQTLEETARAASARLLEAGAMLQSASITSDRIDALTQTVRAYESGLAAMRAGLRTLTIRERALTAEFERRRTRIAQLLGVLGTMGRAPAPLLLLHPTGPIGTARSGQMIAEITPALHAQAEVLRADLETLALLHRLQDEATRTLETGLAGVQTARTRLSDAVSERTDLPRRFVGDATALATLVQNADTLSGFADSLADMPADPTPADTPAAVVGALPLPVTGTRLRGFQESDAAGIRRAGWLVVTPPRALVSTPLPATVRYAGPLLDYGKVIILEPAQGHFMIFAGMSEVYGTQGDILATGSPVGLMGGDTPTAQDFLSEVGQGSGEARPETLYIEVREGDGPVDPATWFLNRAQTVTTE